ncbi:MAG: hypothetical protein ACYC96_07205 [Fimbriimonadaceae bacterium]
MRVYCLLIVCLGGLLGGCGHSDGPIKRAPSAAFVRVVNLSDKPYELKAGTQHLIGPVKPGDFSAFNFVNEKGSPLSLVDDAGKLLQAPPKPAAGADATYVIQGGSVTTLANEERTPPRDQSVKVCFRALDGTKSIVLVGGAGQKTTLTGDAAATVQPGAFKVQSGTKGPQLTVELHANVAYTILIVGHGKSAILLQNTANTKASGSKSSAA